MRFYILPPEKAREIADIIDSDGEAEVDIGKFQLNRGAGEPFDTEALDNLTSNLAHLHAIHIADPKGFDAVASVSLHQHLPNDPELLSDDGFWRWLALGPMRAITLWRFPTKISDESEEKKPFNRQNFGIGASARQRAECYPYKLWLRAELAHADDGDPYRYALRGDVDFWTSHIHRQSYTTNRTLCAALVRFQYPDARAGKPLLISGTENKETGRFGIRTLAKRLRRLQASHELSVLDVADLGAMIEAQANDLARAS